MLGLCKHAVSFQKFGNFELSPIFLSLLMFYQNVFDNFLFYEILDFILKIKVNMCLRVCFIICRPLLCCFFSYAQNIGLFFGVSDQVIHN